jgi:hypothetical protein
MIPGTDLIQAAKIIAAGQIVAAHIANPKITFEDSVNCVTPAYRFLKDEFDKCDPTKPKRMP